MFASGSDAPTRRGVEHLLLENRAPALFAVAKLSQNPVILTVFGFRFERKQNPRIVENLLTLIPQLAAKRFHVLPWTQFPNAARGG